jgi:hypothetical protein
VYAARITIAIIMFQLISSPFFLGWQLSSLRAALTNN